MKLYILGLVFLLSISFAFATTCSCNSCGTCTTQMNNASCHEVQLTTSLTSLSYGASPVCVDVASSNKIFNGGGNTIGYSIPSGLAIGVNLQSGYTNHTVKNLILSNMYTGVKIMSSTVLIDNVNTSGQNNIPLLLDYTSGVTINNSYLTNTISDNRIQSNGIDTNLVINNTYIDSKLIRANLYYSNGISFLTLGTLPAQTGIYNNISKYYRINSGVQGAGFDMEFIFPYSDSDVQGLTPPVLESTLQNWIYQSSWSLLPSPNSVNTASNLVTSRYTGTWSYSGTVFIAPLGYDNAPTFVSAYANDTYPKPYTYVTLYSRFTDSGGIDYNKFSYSYDNTNWINESWIDNINSTDITVNKSILLNGNSTLYWKFYVNDTNNQIGVSPTQTLNIDIYGYITASPSPVNVSIDATGGTFQVLFELIDSIVNETITLSFDSTLSSLFSFIYYNNNFLLTNDTSNTSTIGVNGNDGTSGGIFSGFIQVDRGVKGTQEIVPIYINYTRENIASIVITNPEIQDFIKTGLEATAEFSIMDNIATSTSYNYTMYLKENVNGTLVTKQTLSGLAVSDSDITVPLGVLENGDYTLSILGENQDLNLTSRNSVQFTVSDSEYTVGQLFEISDWTSLVMYAFIVIFILVMFLIIFGVIRIGG